MYLRRFIRGAINTVHANQLVPWLASTGSTYGSSGQMIPTYAPLQSIWCQVQPVATATLAHLEQLNIQGVLRSVYMKEAVASAVRADGTGGDLLQFAETDNGPLRTWLVVLVNEQWPDWAHVTVQLQNDMNNSPWTADSSLPTDSPQNA